ncbi:BLUF domain-containing protein [Sphingomonas jatrophae]|uniref:Sensors of blue-light using FAD n=1 Tax=Sphingomonas jatrophae TaxID=1166337 RepID=A0A1I6M9L4_9SPHN|nr:BLUF domain-containing protein [Sphingomonas jatrophae]SFS12430.1 Sensors of blue-light using FAD [Sphingomonas jatrophae]
MRLLLYTSTNLIAEDQRALDALMVQCRTNNAVDGITGLLWTDNVRFAQALEGGEEAIASLLDRLRTDDRHADMHVIWDEVSTERHFGAWSMVMPAEDVLAQLYEQRLIQFLQRLPPALGDAFAGIVRRGSAHAGRSG